MLFDASYFLYHFYFIPFFYIAIILCLIEDEIIKNFLSYFIMPSLFIGYYYTIPICNYSILFIFFFHWLGDILYIYKNSSKNYFYIHFFFNWIGNLINVYQFYLKIKDLKNYYTVIMFSFTFPIIIFFGIIKLSKYLNNFLHFIFYGYIFPIYLMVLFSILILIENYNLNNTILMIGCLLYIVSNLCVIWMNFCFNFNKNSLIIGTNLIGKFFIVNWFCVNMYSN
jgi:hypothetical protein